MPICIVVHDSVVDIWLTLGVIFLGLLFRRTFLHARSRVWWKLQTNGTNKHLTHNNMKQIHKGGTYQITPNFNYRTTPQMAWSQLGTRPSGISVQSTTNKDYMTHIRIIHWFSKQHIYNRQAWLLETKIIGQAYIKIMIIIILITETYKTVRQYLMAWFPKPSRAGGRGSCRYCNEMPYII